MSWLHVPKCGGTQLAVVLMLAINACFNLTNADTEFLMGKLGQQAVPGASPGLSQPADDMCFTVDLRGYDPVHITRFDDHSGIGMFHGAIQGHGITMLRQPEQRIVSSYNDDYHSWPYYYFHRDPSSILEYASVVSGCAVKMLTRTGQSFDSGHNGTVCGQPDPASKSETELAIKRLNDNYPFVGILEDWELSVCLLHAMYGGKCHSWELGTSDTAGNSTTSVNELEGFTDVADGRLYAAGQRHFKANLERYAVSMPSCSCSPKVGVNREASEQAKDSQRALLTKRHDPKPIAFLHIPKCAGNQFPLSFLTLPGVCSTLSETDWQVIFRPNSSALGNWYLRDHLSSSVEDLCSGVADMRRWGVKFGSHTGITSVYSQFYAGLQAHGFIMLRQPEQRLLSAYYYTGAQATPKDYAAAHAGCTVKLLTRSGAACSDPVQPSDHEVSLAVQRLQGGFAYVGLVDEYDLSVCLLHAMFGGECSASEFTPSNAGTNSTSSGVYDTSVLEGFTDGFDGPVWQQGQGIFHYHLQLFRVSSASCHACWAMKSMVTEHW